MTSKSDRKAPTNRKRGQGRRWREFAITEPRPQLSDWQGELDRDVARFIRQFGHVGAKDPMRRLSERTVTRRREELWRCVELLRTEKRGFEKLSQFKPRYAKVLIELMCKANISEQTQIQYWSTLRWFWRTHGLEDVGGIRENAPPEFRDRYVQRCTADRDRSITGAGLTVEEVLERVERVCPRTRLYLQLAYAFGLRQKEALRLRPYDDATEDMIMLRFGTKAGRPRDVDRALGTDAMRELGRQAIKGLRAITQPGQHAGYPNHTLEQSVRRLRKTLQRAGVTRRELGVTMHGFRHEYAIQAMKAITGAEVPIRGGAIINYRILDEHRKVIMEALGHNRMRISSAYYGSYAKMAREAQQRFMQSWNELKPHLERLNALVRGAGAINLLLSGNRARGTNTNNKEPYEFDLVGARTVEGGQAAAAEIKRFLEVEICVPVRVFLTSEMPDLSGPTRASAWGAGQGVVLGPHDLKAAVDALYFPLFPVESADSAGEVVDVSTLEPTPAVP